MPRTPTSPPKFVYFDLGNVLLFFSHRRGAQQMAAVAGVSPDKVWDIVFAGDLEHQYEAGRLTTEEFYETFCRRAGTRPDPTALADAAGDIFELNRAMVPVVFHLRAAGYPLGILSNTNELHWEFVSRGRYAIIPAFFREFVLSYEEQSMKPEARIYEAAIARAGVAPHEIFFMDDRPENVHGALAAGLDAVVFTSVPQLVEELRSRGIRWNY